jgi:hypothetical protein
MSRPHPYDNKQLEKGKNRHGSVITRFSMVFTHKTIWQDRQLHLPENKEEIINNILLHFYGYM